MAGRSGGTGAACFGCRKHEERGPPLAGGPVGEDGLVLVSHVVTPDTLGRYGTTAYPGHRLPGHLLV